MRRRGGLLLLALVAAIIAVPPIARGADAVTGLDATVTRQVTIGLLVAIGIVTMAVLAIVGRRRARRAAQAEAALVADATAELLRQRALRRARVHVTDDEDPIVAALGIAEPSLRDRRHRR
jgi:hypothetical protein